ncbi:MAG: hypothetical protein SGJ19_12930 [Planctomycetia bacterium]|nr:hypothetical protein [Planctomycetia bacterium]
MTDWAIILGWAPLLAADLETWLKLTFAAVAGLIWIVNQLVNNAKKNQAPPVPRPAQPPVPQRPQPGLEDVQDFLRRAAEQRQREAQRAAQPPKPKQQRPATPKKAPAQTPKKPRQLAKPLSAEVVAEPMRERSVGEHVQKHLDSSQFQQRSSHLSQVAEAPSQIGSHLQHVFDHQVGRLTTGTESDDDPATEGAAVPVTAAAAIARMLSQPESAKQAFILGEIFRRPDSTR